MKLSMLLLFLCAVATLNAQEITAERVANLNPEMYTITGDAVLRTYDNGTLELSLTPDFTTPQGPDVRIFLGTSLSLTNAVELIDLSSINHFSGAYSVTVPAGIDIEQYDYVLFFCVAFQQFWASGQFGETTVIGGGFECLNSSTVALEGSDTVSICPADDAALVTFSSSINAAAGENYAYLITDESNALQHVITTNSFNFVGSGDAAQRVYGVSYSGELSAPIGANRLQTTATECVQHSSGTEFLTVLKDGCAVNECRDHATATTNWAASVSVCAGDEVDDEIELRNSLSISPETNYAYLLTTENEVLLEVIRDTFYNFENSGPDNLRIYGVNFYGELIPVIGANRLQTAASGCFTHSSADLYLTIEKNGTCVSTTFDSELARRITVYPVPTNNVLNVNLPTGFLPQTMRITDLNGRTVIEQNMVTVGSPQIDVSRLVTGTYFLQLRDNERAVSKRFIVLRWVICLVSIFFSETSNPYIPQVRE